MLRQVEGGLAGIISCASTGRSGTAAAPTSGSALSAAAVISVITGESEAFCSSGDIFWSRCESRDTDKIDVALSLPDYREMSQRFVLATRERVYVCFWNFRWPHELRNIGLVGYGLNSCLDVGFAFVKFLGLELCCSLVRGYHENYII